jgi:serine/threonine-protein kinase
MSDDSSNPDGSNGAPTEAVAATMIDPDATDSGSDVAEREFVSGQIVTDQLLTGQTGSHIIDRRYRLIALLGQGGMGNVYKARDVELDEVVALKTLKQELVGDSNSVERFRAEVKLARRVTHRNVARTFDLGMCGDIPYLTMEFVDGEDLSGVLARERRLSVKRFLTLARPVAEGLAAAHSVGVVHRDLKPANVIVCEDGRVVLTDFGIARASQRSSGLTGEGIPIGTPAYMAPEQVQGDVELDHRADIYALGVLAFEMLTGKLPFGGKTPVSTALARLLEEPPNIAEHRKGLPDAIVDLVRRCLMRERDERFANVADLIAALDAVSGTESLASQSFAQSFATGDSLSSASSFAPFSSEQPRHKAVAVLPFRSSGSEEDVYVADGLTEDLIDELSMSQSLKVRPRGAVMPYKQTEQAPREIGEELGVHVIVDGSVRRSGERLRVRVGLVSVEDGFQIWAKRFKGTSGDLFDISEEAARAIVDALTADELGTPQPVAADSQAVDLYLKARHTLHSSWFGDMREAVDLFERALALAPDDPRILSGAALAHTRATFYDVEHLDEHFSAAFAYANRALAISPERPEARLALARVHFDRLDYAPAIEQLRQAIATAPSNADAHDLLGRIMREIGPLETAIRHFKTALELNPNLIRARWDLANAYALTGQWDLADELLEIEIDPDNEAQLDIREATRTRIDTWRDEPKWLDSEAARPLTADSAPVRVMTEYRREVIRTGQFSSEHLAFYKRALAVSIDGTRYRLVIHQLGAEGFAAAGAYDDVFDAIEGAVDAGLLDLMWLEHCPLFDSIQSDPRFEQGRRRVAERVKEIQA